MFTLQLVTLQSAVRTFLGAAWDHLQNRPEMAGRVPRGSSELEALGKPVAPGEGGSHARLSLLPPGLCAERRPCGRHYRRRLRLKRGGSSVSRACVRPLPRHLRLPCEPTSWRTCRSSGTLVGEQAFPSVAGGHGAREHTTLPTLVLAPSRPSPHTSAPRTTRVREFPLGHKFLSK